MRNAKKTEIKMCPFIDGNCVKAECEIYNSLLDRCEIGILAYNLFKLSVVEKARLETEESSD